MILKLILPLIVYFVLCEVSLGQNDHEVFKRVIGGKNAPKNKYHWSVSIKGNVDRLKKAASCGATILEEPNKKKTRWLVSAAHCFRIRSLFSKFDLLDPKLWHARIGLRNVEFDYEKHNEDFWLKDKAKMFYRKFKDWLGKNYEVENEIHFKKIYIHPDYVPGKLENDIALIKLRHSIYPDKMEGVDSIALPSATTGQDWPRPDEKCIVVGWGCTKAGGKAHKVAKLAELKVWRNNGCKKAFNNAAIGLNKKSEFCAGYLKKRYGLCPGDSGSGLACKNRNGKYTLAGVVSAAHSRQPGQYPAIFTRVSYFRNWILETVH